MAGPNGPYRHAMLAVRLPDLKAQDVRSATVARMLSRHLTASRRQMLKAIGTLLATAVATRPGIAAETGERSAHFIEAFGKLTAGRTPSAATADFSLDLPEHAENGNLVQFKLSAESPMTDADHLKAFHLLSTQNPQAHVATFRLTPASGKAAVNGRMRLARTQDVVALAEFSDGRLLIATRKVDVTIGGCGL